MKRKSRRRGRWQFRLRTLLAVTGIWALILGRYGATLRTGYEATLHAWLAGKRPSDLDAPLRGSFCLRVDRSGCVCWGGTRVPINHLEWELKNIAERTAAREPGPVLIAEVDVSGEARYGHFDRVVRACRSSGINSFIVHCGEETFYWGKIAADEPVGDCGAWLPIRVVLVSDRSGSLAEIRVGDRRPRSIDELQSVLAGLAEYNEREHREYASLEVRCDPELRFGDAVEAYAELVRRTLPDGTPTYLRRHVTFAHLDPRCDPVQPDYDFEAWPL